MSVGRSFFFLNGFVGWPNAQTSNSLTLLKPTMAWWDVTAQDFFSAKSGHWSGPYVAIQADLTGVQPHKMELCKRPEHDGRFASIASISSTLQQRHHAYLCSRSRLRPRAGVSQWSWEVCDHSPCKRTSLAAEYSSTFCTHMQRYAYTRWYIDTSMFYHQHGTDALRVNWEGNNQKVSEG